jgi:hypothetical protein
VNTETALKLLFELRAVLERLSESELTLHEALSNDISRAVRLTDACITQLTEESPDAPETDAEED